MQFHALLALTLAASASARLSQRTTLESRALDECSRECTTDYLVSDAYKQADCDSKKDKTCICTETAMIKMIGACLQTNCSDLVDSTREEAVTDCKALKLEFDTDAFDAGVVEGKKAAKESASKSESASATKTSATSTPSETADDEVDAATKTSATSTPSETADDKVDAATTTAASEEAEAEEEADEDNAATRSTLGMMGVLVVAAVAGAFVV